MNFALLCAVVAVVAVALYIRSYFAYPQDTTILQTSMPDFNFDQVLQKQLLVVDDTQTTNDIAILCEGWFRFNWRNRFELVGSDTWHRNRYKYLILQAGEATGDDSVSDVTEVFFFPASNKNVGPDQSPAEGENVLAIQLSPGQSVIVPLHWRYIIPDGHAVHCVGIHDVISYFM